MENNRWFNVAAGNSDRPQVTNNTIENGNTPAINGGGYWLDEMWQGRTWCDWIGTQSCNQFKSILGSNGQNFPPFATAVNIPAIQTMLTAFVTNAAYVWSQPLTQQQAYNQLVECCREGDVPPIDFPCDRVTQSDWCPKFHVAYPQGMNSPAMQGTVNGFISYAVQFGYNLTYQQAYNILLKCCGDGTGIGDRDRWMCEGDQCYSNPNGPYTSLSDCQLNCPETGDRWMCEGDQCYSNPNGPYTSLSDCQSNCPEGPDIDRWRCDGPGCFQCPPGSSAINCPHTENTCNNSCNPGHGSDIPCKYVQAEGICQTYWAHINNNDTQAAMQAVNQFALNEGISSPTAYALVLKCCPDTGTQGEFSCDRVGADWCTKFHAAYPQGMNSPAMQGTVNPFINYAATFGYTLSYSDAYALLLRCCGDGTGTGDRPCPPADPNSPFWTNPDFCTTDYCVDNQGNPLPSAHVDCRCCDENTGNTIDLSPWCDDYATAVDTGDFTTMQQIITTIASTFNLTWQQVAQLLYDECLCDDDNTNLNLPCNLILEGCADYQAYLDGTSPYTLQQLLSAWVNNLALPQMGGHIVTEQQVLDMFQRCCTPTGTGPCENYIDVGCCGKCDNSITPNHPCYSWCQQWADCCPQTSAIPGCTDPNASNYNPNANLDDGSCNYDVYGCTDPTAQNYNPAATVDDGSCMNNPLPIAGCMNPLLGGYNPSATVDCSGNPLPPNGGYGDQNCCGMPPPAPILGCMDPTAQNYNPAATIDDGSCIATVYGCMDPTALNYYPGAQADTIPSSCVYCTYGCTDPTQTNYNPLATCDDGSCIPTLMGCTTPGAINYNPSVTVDDGSCIFPNQIGCTDPVATNYSPAAIYDDGSCTYGAKGGNSSFNGFTNI